MKFTTTTGPGSRPSTTELGKPKVKSEPKLWPFHSNSVFQMWSQATDYLHFDFIFKFQHDL